MCRDINNYIVISRDTIKCTQKQRKGIKLFVNQNRLLLLLCKLLFVVCNENYFSLLTSLLSIYSLSAAHTLAKLTLLVVRFPNNSFYFRMVGLILFYSFSLGLTFFIIINKLVCDFSKYKALVKKYHQTYTTYCKVKENYSKANKLRKVKELNAEKRNENEITELSKFKRQQEQMFSLTLPAEQAVKEERLHVLKNKLSKLDELIDDIQVEPITTTLPSILKWFFFVLSILLCNNQPTKLFLFVILIEVANTVVLIRLNSSIISLVSCLKEFFLFMVFLLMFLSRYLKGQNSRDHYFDFLNALYVVLFFVCSYLIRKNQQRPKVKDV